MTVTHATYLDACTCALRNMRMMEVSCVAQAHKMVSAGELDASHDCWVTKSAIAECIAALKSEMEAVRLPVDK